MTIIQEGLKGGRGKTMIAVWIVKKTKNEKIFCQFGK
jgi:tetraacyldisaccharide-1-P 4'-kinase